MCTTVYMYNWEMVYLTYFLKLYKLVTIYVFKLKKNIYMYNNDFSTTVGCACYLRAWRNKVHVHTKQHTCIIPSTVPTLPDYQGVSHSKTESPGLSYRSPNLLDTKESTRRTLFTLIVPHFLQFRGNFFGYLINFCGWIGRILLFKTFFISNWLGR